MHKGSLLNVFNSTVTEWSKKFYGLKEGNRSLEKDIEDLQGSMQFHSSKASEKFYETNNRLNHIKSDQKKHKKLTGKVTELED